MVTVLGYDTAIKTYKIKCGKLKPPGQKSARIRGPGHIQISDGSIDIDARAFKDSLVILYMIAETVLTAIITWLIYKPDTTREYQDE